MAIAETKPAASEAPDARATREYKKLVFESVQGKRPNEMPTDIVRAAYRLPSDWDQDCSIYKRRLRAVKDLREADRLDQEAAAVVPDPPVESVRNKVVTGMTIGEVCTAIEQLVIERDPLRHNFSAADEKRRDLQSTAREMRRSASSLLSKSCDVSLMGEGEPLRNAIQSVEHATQERHAFAASIAKRKAFFTQEVARLEAGERSLSDAPGIDTKSLWFSARAELRSILRQEPDPKKNAAADAKGAAALVALRARAEKLQAKTRVPENLRWAGE